MSTSGFDLSELTEIQKQVLLASASETLRVASASPMTGGDYDSGPADIKPVLDNSLLGELAKIPELVQPGAYIKELGMKADAPSFMSEIQASGNIVFGGGVPVGGWTAISLYPNGAFNFSGHLHVSGAPSYNVGVTWGVTASDGQPTFSLPVTGRVHGTFEPGSRDFDWNKSGTNPALAAAWPELSAGYRWRWNAGANIDFLAMGQTIMQAIGAVGAVIALV
jgi:hypothetical protein